MGHQRTEPRTSAENGTLKSTHALRTLYPLIQTKFGASTCICTDQGSRKHVNNCAPLMQNSTAVPYPFRLMRKIRPYSPKWTWLDVARIDAAPDAGEATGTVCDPRGIIMRLAFTCAQKHCRETKLTPIHPRHLMLGSESERVLEQHTFGRSDPMLRRAAINRSRSVPLRAQSEHPDKWKPQQNSIHKHQHLQNLYGSSNLYGNQKKEFCETKYVQTNIHLK